MPSSDHIPRPTTRLTKFQANEVAYLLEVANDAGRPQWGTINGRTLEVTDLTAAVADLAECLDWWDDKAQCDGRKRAGRDSVAKLYATLRGFEDAHAEVARANTGPRLAPWCDGRTGHRVEGPEGRQVCCSTCGHLEPWTGHDVPTDHRRAEPVTPDQPAGYCQHWPRTPADVLANLERPTDATMAAAHGTTEAAYAMSTAPPIGEATEPTDPGAWMDGDPPQLVWWVECPDGACLHSEPFPTDDAAFEFARSGHVCADALRHVLRAEVVGTEPVRRRPTGPMVTMHADLTAALFPKLVGLLADLATSLRVQVGERHNVVVTEVRPDDEGSDVVAMCAEGFETFSAAVQWATGNHMCSFSPNAHYVHTVPTWALTTDRGIELAREQLGGLPATNAQVGPETGPETGASLRRTMSDGDALEALAAHLRKPQWESADLERINELVTATGRSTEPLTLPCGCPVVDLNDYGHCEGCDSNDYPTPEEVAAMTPTPPLTVSVTLTRVAYVRMSDGDPDLSWLEQTDDVMGEGFEERARERREAYERGDWWCEVIHAEVYDDRGEIHATSGGLGGVESDATDDHRAEVAASELAELADRLGVDVARLAELPASWVEVG